MGDERMRGESAEYVAITQLIGKGDVDDDYQLHDFVYCSQRHY